MKAILVRSKVTRQVLAGAIFVGRDEVMPFGSRIYKGSVLSHSHFKAGDFCHYINRGYLREELGYWKTRIKERYGDRVFLQEVISNG
ncbi:hypothetical protein FDI99_gp042 [Shigella phage Sf14]|uniref:Uncharacterized protein n=4 Tax=Mooglevirus TaxID=1985303 RepID=A0A2K9VKV7_9CAUD|nr:hypothetical protein FDI99_gp042 [Shigella phage Sf14]YP_009618795.1 hypothetical protein FDJ00_gp043 [Shigella phage Sf17]AUV56333.1 hypothetical protein Sf19_gp117 [Shigella phage Sf19]URY12437.1 hypothetical protein [Shigella phage ESh20]WBF69647.1 hypothetical protein SFPB_083 [Shigella phage SFPB]AUV62856.1 hypothetical protein Sf14_gp115 [Shigella phage Sf14]AUV62991.1 hypothetical protein Sf17_gp119 [Shigella phage Sf17]